MIRKKTTVKWAEIPGEKIIFVKNKNSLLKKPQWIGWICLCLLFSSLSFSQVYQLDLAHSSLSFTIRHMTISKVRGHFTDFNVEISANEKDITLSSVKAVIKADSINTNNEKRDGHLRSSDFFEVEKFPEIVFVSKKISKAGKNYQASGDLTMHGITKPIVIEFELSEKINDQDGKIRIGIEGKTTLDRKDFGISWNKTIDKGGMILGNEVKVEILLEMISKPSEPAL
jgi:polyisoprenoid-binding protein YceI